MRYSWLVLYHFRFLRIFMTAPLCVSNVLDLFFYILSCIDYIINIEV